MHCAQPRRPFLVSGSLDGSVVTWSIGGAHNVRDEMLELFGGATLTASSANKAPLLTVLRYLSGHRAGVVSVAVSSQAGLVASGATDGRVLLHTLQTGELVRSVAHGELGSGAADLVCLVPGAGAVVSHSRASRVMVSDTVNGRQLARLDVGEAVNFVVVATSMSLEVLVCGNELGDVAIRRVEDLVVTRRIAYTKRYRGVRCGACAANGAVIYFGCNDGSLVVLSDGSELIESGAAETNVD